MGFDEPICGVGGTGTTWAWATPAQMIRKIVVRKMDRGDGIPGMVGRSFRGSKDSAHNIPLKLSIRLGMCREPVG
jgi:hypothetical protein